jgi:hypothetical protein
MSFFDDISGLFTGDTYYPDNQRRQTRSEELARDCQAYLALAGHAALAVRAELRQLNARLASPFGQPESPGSFTPRSTDYGGLSFEIAQIVAPALAAEVADWALTIGATTYLVSTGAIGEAALITLVGLPLAFTVGIGVGVVVVGVAVTLAIGAIEGGVKRDHLRNVIHEAVPARRRLYRAAMINERLETHVKRMSNVVDAMIRAGLGGPKIEGALAKLAQSSQAEIEAITETVAESGLSNIDRGRGSWTNEDS